MKKENQKKLPTTPTPTPMTYFIPPQGKRSFFFFFCFQHNKENNRIKSTGVFFIGVCFHDKQTIAQLK